MRSRHFKIIPRSLCQTYRLLVLLLMAGLAAASQASDLDFAKSELNRLGRSKLTNDQRQAASLLDRYQRQKNAQKKALQPAPAPGAQTAEQTPALAPRATTGPLASQAAQPPKAFVKIDCVQMLAKGAEKKYPKTQIMAVQQQLIDLGFNPDQVDGLLGPKTRGAIEEYCKIDKAYPHWPLILESNDFVDWAAASPDQKGIVQAQLSGSASQVIALLTRYKQRKPGAVVKKPRALVTWTDDVLFSYSLTKDDFSQLKSPNEVFKRIGKLQGEAFTGKREFEAGLETTLKGVAEPERYIRLVQKYAEPQTGLMLTEKSFNSLKVDNVPDYILQSILGLKGLNYPEDKLDDAVAVNLGKLTDRTLEFKPLIVKLAEISPSGARFTDEALKKFSEAQKDDPLAVAILDKVQYMKGVEYQSDKTLTSAVKNVLMQVVEQINSFQPVIVESAEEVSDYTLSEESMQEVNSQLKEFAVPEIYLDILADMKDVEYPDADLFWLAMKAKLAIIGSNNILRKKIFGVIETNAADKMDESLLGKLKARDLPPSVITYLGTLQGRKFDDTKALEDAVDALFAQLSEQYEQYRSLVIAQGRKIHRFDKTKNIQWSGESCNCVRDNLSGEVYGFYPYWMAGEKQVLDFSVLTRIGYYGLGFDDKGNIANASRWSDLDTGFIREAKTYGSKVDLVIYRNDWQTWKQTSADDKAVAFENLATNIASLVGIPLTNIFSSVTPYISLGTSPHPIMGDGVTLYFDGYPRDAESVDAFSEFIRNLSAKLKTQHRKYSVNIMFRSAEMGNGIYDYYKLIDLIDIIKGKDNKLKSLFLVLLQEPTTNDKKLLRLHIENGLHGSNRMKLLRNVVMAITFDGHNVDQLTDDVIYAKDNFAGIGFWPQSVASGAVPAAAQSSGIIGAVLHGNYLDLESGDAPFVCSYVCPNKWAFRIAWGLFFLSMVVSIFMRFMFCEWRSYFDQHFIHFIVGIVVPASLLSLALLFCDPGWQQVSRGNGVPIFMLMVGIGYSIWSYQDKKRKANLP